MSLRSAFIGPLVVFVLATFVACSGASSSIPFDDVDGSASGANCDGGTCTPATGTDASTSVCQPGAACTRQDCSNTTCTCAEKTTCDLSCTSPPCHAQCAKESTCSASCGNGDCNCGEGASCSFTCASPPCHVTCDGKNPRCDGECANGTCSCGEESSCHFTCIGGPCHITCPKNATCLVSCTKGGAGTQNCDFTSCTAGTPVICPGGNAIACGTACP